MFFEATEFVEQQMIHCNQFEQNPVSERKKSQAEAV